ncbi:MAG: hypothetical protein JXA25_03100 [Anaerolineales bacterium]|nr:hypothetical protein [Anaerolineales bacterium]
MDYGEILSKAWKITWKHKGLWILGILAGCSTNGGGGGGGSSSRAQYNMDSGDFHQFYQFSHSPFFQWLSDIPEGVWLAIAIGFILFIITLSILFWVLASIGKSGLFAAFKQADETGSTTLKEAFSAALRNFWKILVIEIAIGLATFLVILVLLAPMICCFPLIFLLILGGILIHVLTMLIEIAIVADEKHLTEAPAYIWNLLKANVGDTIVIALLLGAIKLILSLLIGLPALLVFIPVILGIFIEGGQMLLPSIGMSVLLLLFYMPVAIILSGVLQTFHNGAWTLFYQRIKQKPLPEKKAESADE